MFDLFNCANPWARDPDSPNPYMFNCMNPDPGPTDSDPVDPSHRAGFHYPCYPQGPRVARVQNSTRKPEVADDIKYIARVQIHVILLCMSTQCVREGVHGGVTMETLPDRVPVLLVENYPNPIPEENATRLSPCMPVHSLWEYLGCALQQPSNSEGSKL